MHNNIDKVILSNKLMLMHDINKVLLCNKSTQCLK